MKQIHRTLNGKLEIYRRLVTSAHDTDTHGTYKMPLSDREVITNACFLNMFIALEEFIEAAFLHYAVGRMSTGRWRPRKYMRPIDEAHANRMLVGTQRFVDWSTPDTIRKLARLYFDSGEPFETPFAAANQHLLDMKTVRNATAHLSRTTQAALDGLRTRWTGAPVSGSSAYEMLLSARLGAGDSFLTVSGTTIDAISTAVANRV